MKILILGFSPLPFENRNRLYAPGTRTFQLARPLAEDGHEVHLVCCRYDEAYLASEPALIEGQAEGLTYALLDAPLFMEKGWIEDYIRKIGPDGLVGVTSAQADRAAGMETGLPLWADLFGHFMAEGQAKAVRYADDGLLADYYKVQVRVLDAADAFSVVSGPQGLALIGELGLRGRLNRKTGGHHFFSVMPIAFDDRPLPPAPAFRGTEVPEDAFMILWSGGYNTWTDEAFLFRVLERVMAADPAVCFVSTGGAMARQDEKTYRLFQKRVEGSRFKDRFFLKGWIPLEDALGHYHEADVGLNVDRDLYEVTLGSKNRIMDWMRAGLPAVTTPLTEIGDVLGREKLAFLYQPGDEDGLAVLLQRLASDREGLRPLRAKIMAFGRNRFSMEKTTEPLRAWAADPSMAPDAGQGLSFEKNLAEALEKTMAECAERQKHIDNLLAMCEDKDRRIADQDGLIRQQQAALDKIHASLPYRGYAWLRRLAGGGK
jgi:glycosyltransferase involved in cell wall biosynthesis